MDVRTLVTRHGKRNASRLANEVDLRVVSVLLNLSQEHQAEITHAASEATPARSWFSPRGIQT